MKYISLNTECLKSYYKELRRQSARCLRNSRKLNNPVSHIDFKWYLKYKNEAEGIVSLLYVSSHEFSSEAAVVKYLKG
jgi:hypothetical protein